jgi:hypothetical protein
MTRCGGESTTNTCKASRAIVVGELCEDLWVEWGKEGVDVVEGD